MAFRKRRRPTPGFGIPPPFNPITGDHANLRIEGVYPYCAMMQVAADDYYNEYVICRGFDTRILKFIDYEAGNADKPGISVAKPFGRRGTLGYQVGQVYPALLPTQGSVDDGGAASHSYVPPSPTGVLWRVGQNPGKVADNVGHPQSLGDEITILTDHNGKAVNWLLIDSGSNVVRYAIGQAWSQPGASQLFETATDAIVEFANGVSFANLLWDETEHKFTCEFAGVYDVDVAGRLQGTTLDDTYDVCEVNIMVNGIAFETRIYNFNFTHTKDFMFGTFLSLQIGDEIQVKITDANTQGAELALTQCTLRAKMIKSEV